jgi:hypothetical protein
MASSLIESIDKKADKLKDQIGLRLAAWPLFILGLALLLVALVFAPGVVRGALSLAFYLAPVWLPVLMVGGAYELWYVYKRSEFIAAQKNILLEIKPPRNLVKTPLAMETFLSTIHLTGGESNWWARLMGGIRPFWSLEIASFEGQVHFYIWGRAANRRLVESQLYAQYPGVQVVEAIDYTRTIPAPSDEWFVWGCDYKHTAEDPLPIKTYVEYGLDKVQKEPEQIDPLANVIEFMGSMGKGEYLWIQHVIRAHKGEKYNKFKDDGKEYTWVDAGREMVEKIRKSARDEYTDPATGKKVPGFPNPTKGESEKMAAIERNIGKLAFDVGMRGIYVARKDKINGGSIGHLIALYKPFTTAGWNGIDSTAWLKSFNDYPWETWEEKRKEHYRKELVEAYRRRQFFYPPFFEGGMKQEKVMVMSVEELATVFHIPSRAVETPGLVRIASATSEAPPNLPV